MLKSHKNNAEKPNLDRILEPTKRETPEVDLSFREPNRFFVMWTSIRQATPAIGKKIVAIALSLLGINVAPEFLPIQDLVVEIVNYLLLALLGFLGITYTADKAKKEAEEVQ